MESSSANTFSVTAVATQVQLDAQRRGLASFTVTNSTDQPRRGRAQVVPLQGAEASWFTVVGDVSRAFGPGATEQYPVQLAVPPTAAAGTHSFRLDAVAEDNPDEDTTSGPIITFDVPAPATAPKRKFPWWILAVVLVVLIGAAVAIALVAGGDDDEPEPPKPRPAAAYAGTWVNPDSTSRGVPRMVIAVDGDTLDVRPAGCPNFQLGPVKADRLKDIRRIRRCTFSADPVEFTGEPIVVTVRVNFVTIEQQTREFMLAFANAAKDRLKVTESRAGETLTYTLDKQAGGG